MVRVTAVVSFSSCRLLLSAMCAQQPSVRAAYAKNLVCKLCVCTHRLHAPRPTRGSQPSVQSAKIMLQSRFPLCKPSDMTCFPPQVAWHACCHTWHMATQQLRQHCWITTLPAWTLQPLTMQQVAHSSSRYSPLMMAALNVCCSVCV